MFEAVSRFFAARVRIVGTRVVKSLPVRGGSPRRGRGLRTVLAAGTVGQAILSGCHGVGPPQVGVAAPAVERDVVSLTSALRPLTLMRQGELRPARRLGMPPNVAWALKPRPGVRARLADRGARVRLVVSTASRTLSLLEGSDTLYQVPVAVASGLTLVYGGRAWRFSTPRGERRVLRKVANPVWTPPDWHYAEAANDHGLRLAPLPSGGKTISRGRRLEIRDRVVGIIDQGGTFRVLPTDEHIVFDGYLFIPPIGTLNRRLHGDLGRFALDLGHGYMIHGSSDEASIGAATTHGCIRLGAFDLAWFYENIPVGTRVVIG